MKNHYRHALRQERSQSARALKGYASELFPTNWCYKSNLVEQNDPTTKELSEKLSEKPLLESDQAFEQKPAESVTEKTKILDSLHEFAHKRFNEEEKEAFSFPGGAAVKKAASNLVFEGLQTRELSFNQLKELSSMRGESLKALKFETPPLKLEDSKTLKALFVAPETEPLETLEEKAYGLEAFFNSQPAELFGRMIKAMKLAQGEFFVSSLDVLSGDGRICFKEALVQEIFHLRPQVVIPLGGKVTSAFLGEGHKLQSAHGQFFARELAGPGNHSKDFEFEVMPLFSPAFLVEAPNTKRIAWEDMQKVMKKLGL